MQSAHNVEMVRSFHIEPTIYGLNVMAHLARRTIFCQI